MKPQALLEPFDSL